VSETPHILVCPYDGELLGRLRERTFVLTTSDPSDIDRIASDMARDEHLHVHAISLQWDRPFADLDYRESWRALALAIYVPEMGPFKRFVSKLPALRRSQTRIFQPADRWQNLLDVQIRASLGVWAGLRLEPTVCDWNRLNDLMHYAVYSVVNHAPIEPFYYLANAYKPEELTDYASVYFDSPNRFLHIGREGDVALTREDLAAGRFVPKGCLDIDEIAKNDQYRARLESWRLFFLDMNACASCPGWRICLGKFRSLPEHKACAAFFSDLMEAVEFSQSRPRNSRTPPWP
jgi:hypothetical protein